MTAGLEQSLLLFIYSPCVSHSSVSGLRGALVLSGLQPHVCVPHLANLLGAEVAAVLGRNLGAERRARVLGVILGLEKKKRRKRGFVVVVVVTL